MEVININYSRTRTVKSPRNQTCLLDILCKNKKCSKLHIKRKELNICKFDIFFVPYGDGGCHFEDCTFKHPNRDNFLQDKEKHIDNLVNSVFNSLGLDDDIPIMKDWNKLINNINNDFMSKYNELYNYVNIINTLCNELQKVQLFDKYSYIDRMNKIIVIIRDYYLKFTTLFRQLYFEFNCTKQNINYLNNLNNIVMKNMKDLNYHQNNVFMLLNSHTILSDTQIIDFIRTYIKN